MAAQADDSSAEEAVTLQVLLGALCLVAGASTASVFLRTIEGSTAAAVVAFAEDPLALRTRHFPEVYTLASSHHLFRFSLLLTEICVPLLLALSQYILYFTTVHILLCATVCVICSLVPLLTALLSAVTYAGLHVAMFCLQHRLLLRDLMCTCT
jgi:hypothetical protein